MALSRLKAGCVFGEPKTVELHTGREVTVGVGEAWCSTSTLRDDINAALGNDYSYNQVRYATQKAEKAGFVEKQSVAGGRYGSIFKLNADILTRKGEMVDVVKTARTYFYGDVSEFERGEIVVAEKNRRGKYGLANKWQNYVAQNGMDESAFTSIGRWRLGEEGDPEAPVFIPWLMIDIDRLSIPDAHDDVRAVVMALEEQGYDLERVFVSFSGSKGFHVAISSDQFGTPLYVDSLAARETVGVLVKSITDVRTDTSINNPRSLIRVTGSRHEKTGNYKRSWTAKRFMSLALHEALEDLRSHEPFEYPDPTAGEVEQDVLRQFEDAAERAVAQVKSAREEAEKYGNVAGGTIRRISEGIAEGEHWHDRHVGRNKAGYILACWLIESEKQQRSFAHLIGYNPSVPFGTEECAREIYRHWDNTLNSPPMQEGPEAGDIKGFRAAFESAKRKILNRR